MKALTAVAPADSARNVRVIKEVNNLLGEQVASRQAQQGRSGGDVFQKVGMWVEGLANYSKQDTTTQSSGFTGKTTGFALGLDGALNEQTTIGFGYGYNHTKVDADSGDTDVDGHTLFAYAKYQPSKFYVRGMLNYGFASYDEKANVGGIGVKADYDVQNIGALAMTGYDFSNGLMPEAGLRYVHLMQDSYTDSIGQHISTDDTDILTGVVGVKYTKIFADKGIVWTPKSRVALTYDLLSDDSKANVNIGGINYEVNGEKLERLGVEAGVSLEADIDNWNFSVGYDMGLRKDYISHTGMFKAKYEF